MPTAKSPRVGEISLDKIQNAVRILEGAMNIVSACPRCGCPIYGREAIGPDDNARAAVRRSCTCEVR